MTRPLLVFVHGWGADASCWERLRAALPPHDAVGFDLGFFGRPARPAVPARGPRVAVAHSLGLLWLLHERPFAWDGLVSLAGFARFTRADDFPAGVAPRLLERMIARARREPEATLRDFWAGSGGEAAAPRADWTGRVDERLVEGLEWLGRWDERAVLAADGAPALALAAVDDAVVPTALTEAAFASRRGARLAVSPGGGHALPWSRAAWCAGQISPFLEALP